ncbi:MAG TPA: tripartite tricarboxylate transporter substrate binding protein [Burkholderiales bacterium]|nr:tripartite tricarboxylate transporter substrate binding protein [Burkholderiales bacterium]
MTVGLLAAGGVYAAEQSYPTKPIRLIVPFAAGGPVDTMARIIAPHLSAAFKQSVVIDNRSGAAGLIGIEAGVRAAPDGYTITMVSSSYSASASTLTLPYHPVNDIRPIVLVTISPQLAAVHPSLPVTSVQELIAYAKANPGKLNYGSSGTGGSVHLSTEFFNMMAGTRMTHVPYKGQGPALNDLIGGQIQLLLGSPLVIYPHVKAGRLRALAVTSAKRSSAMPEVPTFLETVPGYETYAWQAFIGPKALPQSLVNRWNAETNRILQLPEIKARLAADGVDAGGGPPSRFFDLLKHDLEKWEKVVAYAKLKTH